MASLISTKTQNTKISQSDTMAVAKVKKIKIKKSSPTTPTPQEKHECSICCDDVLETNMIKCINHRCQFSCCKACLKHYLKDNPMNTKCMECDTLFNHTLLIDMLSKGFVMGELRKLQKKVWLERQLAQIPATQLSNEFKIIKIRKQIAELTRQYKNQDSSGKDIGYYDYHRKKEFLEEELENIENYESSSRKNTREGPSIFMKCTNNECRGFVTTEKHQCEVCETFYCKKCAIEKGEGHECKNEDIETAKFIFKESKPCPSCGTRISKVSGCDQMWCTQCHVSFSWKTGTIEKGVVHNPHYFEWLRKGGGNREVIRNPNDVRCGGLVNADSLSEFLKYLQKNRNFIITNTLFGCMGYNKVYNQRAQYENYETIFTNTGYFSDLLFKTNVGNKYRTITSYIEEFIKNEPSLSKDFTDKFDSLTSKIKKATKNHTTVSYDSYNVLRTYYNRIKNFFKNPIFDKVADLYKIVLKENKAEIARVSDEFFVIYRELSHAIAVSMRELRRHIQTVENEEYMFKKRVEFILGEKTEKQLCESASRREYTLMRERSKLHLYEFIEMIGVEESRALKEDLDKIFRHTIYDTNSDDVNLKYDLHYLRTDILDALQLPQITFASDENAVQATEALKQKMKTLIIRCAERYREFNNKIMNAFSYFNEEMRNISKQYNCKPTCILENIKDSQFCDFVSSDDDDDDDEFAF